MIFDLLLLHNTKDSSKGNEDFQNSIQLPEIYEKVDAPSKIMNLEGMSLYMRFRNRVEDSLIDDSENLVIIVGEVFSRYDSAFFNSTAKILTVAEVYSCYRAKHEKFLEEIKGNFQIIIFTKESKNLVVYNSRGGVSPFYYFKNNTEVVLSTAIYLFPKRIKDSLKFSQAHMLEYALFNYPLGEHTLFSSVSNLLPGQIIQFKGDSFNSSIYYDVYNQLNSARLSKQEAIDKGVSLFENIVNTSLADKEKYCISLTGGFDGRAILTASKKPKEDILLYAFGIRNSQNIAIPLEITKDMGYNFTPYYLEEDYSKNYAFYGKMVCQLTDCLATVQRANYAYVFEKLAKYSDTVITGIFGSELMRTFQNAGFMISEPAVAALKNSSPLDELGRIIDSNPHREYWGEKIFNQKNKEEVLQSFKDKYMAKSYTSLNHFIFTYFIKDALRKYFGGEVHSERIFGTNRFPFFDDEFVDFILQSPFSAINNVFMDPGINERISSQKFYAHIIKKTNPKLLDYTTDHGFAPKYLLYPFPMLFIGPQFVMKSYLQRKHGYKEFNSVEWFTSLLDQDLSSLNQDGVVNTNLMKSAFSQNNWVDDINVFRKLFSLQYYTQTFS